MIKQTSSLMGESIYYPARARGLTRGREEAVDEAMQHKVAQGEYTGGQTPYGRRVASCGQRLEPDPQEEA